MFFRGNLISSPASSVSPNMTPIGTVTILRFAVANAQADPPNASVALDVAVKIGGCYDSARWCAESCEDQDSLLGALNPESHRILPY
jgi:hypothetical protein